MRRLAVFHLVMATGMALLSSGCTTLMYPNDEQLRQQAEIDRLKSDVRRLKGQVDELIVSQERMFSDLGEVRASQQTMLSDLQDGLNEVRGTVRSEASARESMHGEIVSQIGDKVTKILKREAEATPATRTERGYEHVVKSGETLSEIASVYGATVEEVVKLNKLSSANVIRVGQKLFIPAQ